MSAAAVAERKRALRAALRAARRALPPAQAAAEAAATVAACAALIAALRPGAVASYCALRGELDLEPLHARLRAAGARLLLPRVAGPGILTWHRVADPGALAPGAFGVPEPDPRSHPPAELPEDALILVPGVAFGGDGRRLGQGGGFYDRVLAGAGGWSVGVGFACQRCDDLPEEPHDRRVDGVVLAGAVLREPARG